MQSSDDAGSRRADIWRGVRDIFPITLATTPIGVIFGAIAAQQGMAFAQSTALSGLVYAGASQFVALQSWADPLPVWTLLLSVLAVNLRHVLYSAGFGRKTRHWPVALRYAGFGLLVDPTYALAELDPAPRLSAAYYFGMAVPLYFYWIVATAIGYLAGNLVGDPQQFGLDFVATAFFIVLVAGFRKRPNSLPVILVSGIVAVATFLTLGTPWHFATGAMAGIATAALLPRQQAAA